MTAFVQNFTPIPLTLPKPPTMGGSDKLHQDRVQREMTIKINQLTYAVTEMQAYLATLP